MEYLFEITDLHGRKSTITDPANPCTVGGAFGDKSVVSFPGYRRPEWLEFETVDLIETSLRLPAAALGSEVTGVLWQPRSLSASQPAPLIVVHDGPEYAVLGDLTRYLGASIAAGLLPPLRAALLGPGDRNNWYAANPAYARALSLAVLPAIDRVIPSTVRVGVGVSLGGLALLHVHRTFPRLFDALMLQSASFFTPRTDPQESGFSGFGRVTRFVGEVHASQTDASPVATLLTCGVAEENLANNRAMAETLRRLAYPVRMIEVRDAHNYTAWRDALHPHFTQLLSDLVGTP
jgi:enterochelin esterase family protein